MSNSEDYLHLDRTNLMNELRDLSAKYNQSYAIQLQTETRTKELNASLFIKYKTGQEKISVKENAIIRSIKIDGIENLPITE